MHACVKTLMHSTTNTVGTEVTASLSSLIDANAEPKGEAKDEAKDEEEKERKELCDELTETINALVQEIQVRLCRCCSSTCCGEK